MSRVRLVPQFLGMITDPPRELIQRPRRHQQIAVGNTARTSDLVSRRPLAYAVGIDELTLAAQHARRGFQPHHASHSDRKAFLFRLC